MNEAIDDAPLDDVEAVNESEQQEAEQVVEQDVEQPESDEQGGEKFPKKAVNALNRKTKTINKLRAQMRELEAKLNEVPKVTESKPVNPDDFENYGDFIDAQIQASVEKRIMQSQNDLQKQQLTQQQESLKVQRDQYIIEQAQEAAKTLTDLPQVWQQNAQTLDALPESIADIFYSIDNAPAAVYVLAKEGKLESLALMNPAIAAYEIVNAQNKGMEMISVPKPRASQAPQPITKAKANGSVKKQLSAESDVLKSLGLK